MKRQYIIIFIVVMTLITLGIGYIYTQPKIEELDYNTFVSYLEAEQVKEINIKNDEILQVTMNDDKVYRVDNPQKESMKEYFLLNGVAITNNRLIQEAILPIGSVALIGIIFFIYRKKGFSKDKLQLVNANGQKNDESSVHSFNNVAGNEEAKDLVKDIIDFIKDPDKYSKLGAKMPKGILLYGPPGTGKTLMAKAIAGESGVPFYAVSGSDFVQMYVGVGASRIRQLFKKAKQSTKAVIFIDEIDAIGKKRANGPNSNSDEKDQTLNALLTEMSGFNNNSGVVVIAATNRLDTLDDALIRPGRFDRLIEIGLPDINARRRILDLHIKDKPIHSAVNMDKVAKETVYFSGAMLESLANEAAIIAANSNSTEIIQDNFEVAFYNVIAGSAKKDRSTICKDDCRITAYHESGHALATKLLLPENTVSKVTIIPSTKGFGGFSMSIPKDRLYKSKQDILSDIKVMLAGRVAEELIFGADNITTGASNDIEKASRLIKEYVIKFGMDYDFGLFNHDAANMNADSAVMEKCREQMKKLYEETKKVIENNIDLLNQIAQELILKETLNESDIDILFSNKKSA
ncbi:ATP-dependent zinc metalloprotease FtsH [Alkalibaculum sp. M08DMB]|uniref:ATP-dependent zinc metalloprotease FtsH n=1 Tax=Alkalibaculum sporogenes TaxID=2655001 RepID=A0A6A7K9A9_9FIRM|nr:FtsH/Yme1/Tma family ATP-dependent metallopeptidase [Alkalibaculum sporogenes]MPW25777.1 ATP-dependent zinc metalloprotease FtsH [Alkalibaculum sporogenes]